MNGGSTSTFSARLCFNLVSISLIAVAIYLGRGILIPLFFSILFALILSPITNYFIRKDMHRFLAILVPLVLGLLIISLLVYFLSSQISLFFNDVPALEKRFEARSCQPALKERPLWREARPCPSPSTPRGRGLPCRWPVGDPGRSP